MYVLLPVQPIELLSVDSHTLTNNIIAWWKIYHLHLTDPDSELRWFIIIIVFISIIISSCSNSGIYLFI